VIYMSEASIDWAANRDFVLARKRASYSGMADYQRNLPVLPLIDSTGQRVYLSPNDIINEVEHLTDLGKKIIVAELKLAGKLQ
jgi:hypothetical protein